MKVLIVGGGGREHALCWKIAQSNIVDRVFCAPGNAGIASVAECVDLKPTDLDGLETFAKKASIDLTVVGPEAPLAAGIVDRFQERGLRIFGPNRRAAQLEASKAFCKGLLRRHGIPTAGYRVFTEFRAALASVRAGSFPTVIKADGLAGGKGTMICNTAEEAEKTLREFILEGRFGEAGRKVVIEEYLSGIESSIMAICDGGTLLVLDNTQDHKKLYDGEIGPNTGGMGAYSPVPFVGRTEMNRVISKILVPTVHAMRREGAEFRGVLYAGLMFTKGGPRVLEFNVRFGDPETQPLLLRLRSDLVPILLTAAEGKLDQIDTTQIEWDPRAAVTVVLASAGYPGEVRTGFEIQGLEEAEVSEDVIAFHAGTKRSGGSVVTSGGRVLGVSALGRTIEEARNRAYEACRKIQFKGIYYRRDIALRAVRADAAARTRKSDLPPDRWAG